MHWAGECCTASEVCQKLGLGGVDSYCRNATNLLSPEKLQNTSSAAVEYWEYHVLGHSSGQWNDWGGLRWQSVLCLAAAWTIVAVCLIKGVRTSGKVVYFTSLFPYLVLTLLACRGLTLPGALDGVMFYLRPDWQRLLQPQLWVDAATQVIFSLGPACGCIVTLSSYNKEPDKYPWP